MAEPNPHACWGLFFSAWSVHQSRASAKAARESADVAREELEMLKHAGEAELIAETMTSTRTWPRPQGGKSPSISETKAKRAPTAPQSGSSMLAGVSLTRRWVAGKEIRR
jgi:hypothetical protein